jgi:hypothetical protein
MSFILDEAFLLTGIWTVVLQMLSRGVEMERRMKARSHGEVMILDLDEAEKLGLTLIR